MTTETWRQASFRGRNDTVALCTNTWTFALNTNFSFAVDANFRVRFKIANETASSQTLSPTLRYSTTGISGTYSAVGAGTPVKLSATAQYANQDVITGACSFLPVVGSNGGGQASSGGTLANDTVPAGFADEFEWCLQLDSAQVANNDIIHLRVYDGTTALNTYTNTAAVTVIEAGGAFVPEQNAYRFAEDGTEAGATLIGSLNTALSRDVTSGDSNLQLRIRIQETGGAAGAATDDYQLQRSINGAAFANVTSTSTGAKSNTGSALTDGSATTNRLGSGTGSFVAGEQEEANGIVEDSQLTASNFTEHVWALTLVAAELADADQLTFRVLENGATMTYNQTPTINVVKTPPAATSLIFPALQPSMRALLVQ